MEDPENNAIVQTQAEHMRENQRVPATSHQEGTHASTVLVPLWTGSKEPLSLFPQRGESWILKKTAIRGVWEPWQR